MRRPASTGPKPDPRLCGITRTNWFPPCRAAGSATAESPGANHQPCRAAGSATAESLGTNHHPCRAARSATAESLGTNHRPCRAAGSATAESLGTKPPAVPSGRLRDSGVTRHKTTSRAERPDPRQRSRSAQTTGRAERPAPRPRSRSAQTIMPTMPVRRRQGR